VFVVATVLGTTKDSIAGLVFNFTPAPAGVPQEVADGFAAAGERWSSIFLDDVTINIQMVFTGFPSLGIALFEADNYAYSDVRAAIGANVSSADDQAGFNQLQAGPAIDLLINRTSNSPHGNGSPIPYLDDDGDANNTSMGVLRANAKALGLIAADDPASDGIVIIDSGTTWDFDPSNGITPGQRDFVGVATHEIGHMLGFISGVDGLDINSSGTFFPDDFFTFVSPIDLFRYSDESIAEGAGIIDWTADTRDKYFSLDGGITPIESFSTGDIHGNGSQASHWIPSSPGIMNPSIPAGFVEIITPVDIQILDVIGWDVVPVPEPSSLVLLGFGSLALLACCTRCRKTQN